MATFQTGGMTSDKLVGLITAYSNMVATLRPEETQIASYLSPGLRNLKTDDGMVPGGSNTFKYAEKVYKPAQTQLNGALTALSTEVTVDDAMAKPGDVVVVDSEAILLGAATDSTYKTFDITSGRATFGGSAAAHDDDAPVLLLGTAFPEASNAPTAGAITQRTEVTTYTENLIEVVKVSGGARFMQQFAEGQIDKLAEYTAEQNLNLRHQLENRILWDKAQAPSGEATAGRFDGGYQRVASTNYTSLSDDNIQYSDVQKGVREIRRRGGRPRALFVSDYQGDQIDTWPLPYQKVEPSDLARAIFGANVMAIRVGEVVLDVIKCAKMLKHAMIVSPEFIGVGPKDATRAFHPEELAKLGDYDQIMLVGEYTLQWANPYAHYWFTNCKWE